MSEELKSKAVDALNKFIQILLNREQTALDRDTYQFSFKKAHTHARHYSHPVVTTRTQKLKTTGIGHTTTYEKGTEYKLWIDKKPSSPGLPAPLVLFFGEENPEVKLSYVGSL